MFASQEGLRIGGVQAVFGSYGKEGPCVGGRYRRGVPVCVRLLGLYKPCGFVVGEAIREVGQS